MALHPKHLLLLQLILLDFTQLASYDLNVLVGFIEERAEKVNFSIQQTCLSLLLHVHLHSCLVTQLVGDCRVRRFRNFTTSLYISMRVHIALA